MRINKLLRFTILISLTSCQNDTEKWLGNLYSENYACKGHYCCQVAGLDQPTDTTTLKFRVRVTETALDRNAVKSRFYYQADSLFLLKNNSQYSRPVMIEPVANGLATTHDFLVFFKVEPWMKNGDLEFEAFPESIKETIHLSFEK